MRGASEDPQGGSAGKHVSDCTLTILILCRNEEGSIAQCVGEARQFLARNDIAGEVLVLDNGSTDRSLALAEGAGARVALERQPGYGNAVRAGIAAARGQYIILGDGDGEHDLAALGPFWEALRAGYELVIGNRFAGDRQPGAQPFLNRYVGAPLLSAVGKLFSGAPISDFHCGLRGFSAAMVRALALQAPGMELASEMVIKAMHKNLRIVEVPVTQRRALDGTRLPHLRIWSDGWRHLRLLLMLSPRWLFLYPGCVLWATGLVLMAMPIVFPVETGGAFGAHTAMFGAGFFVCGAQIACFTLHAQVFAESIGLSAGGLHARVQRVHLLEYGLGVGFLLALAGLAGGIWSLWVWAEGVEIEARLRVAVPSVAVAMLGVQAMFSAFLLEILTMQSQRPGIGDNRPDAD